MKRHLLFDPGCALCSDLARDIEKETGGWLTARNLRDPEVQALLERARPDHRWEPMLMEVEGERVRVFSGLAMRMRLVVGLGLRRAWRVAKLVRKAGGPALGIDWGRRELLRRGGALLTGLAVWPHISASKVTLSGEGHAPNPKVRVTEMRGSELEAIIKQIRNDKRVRLLWKHLLEVKFMPTTHLAYGVRIRNADPTVSQGGIVVYVPFQSNHGRSAQIIYASDGQRVQAGAGIAVQEGRDLERIDILEVVGARVLHTETIVKSAEGSLSVRRPDGSAFYLPQRRIVVPTATNDCDTCHQVFGYIFGGGCGLAGYFACNVACGVIGGPACPPICAVVYALICVFGYGNNVEIVCEPWCG